MNRRVLLLVALLAVTGIASWWFDSDPRAVADPAPSAAASAVDKPPPVAAERRAAQPDTGPNIATAPAFTRERPTAASQPIPLPQPVDAHLDPQAARALFKRYEDAHDCLAARIRWGDWERMTSTYWLPTPERERVLAGRQGAVERMLGVCRRQGFRTTGEEFDEVPPGYLIWARQSAAASGDLAARLFAVGRARTGSDPVATVRSLVEEALRGGEPELVAASGAVVVYNELGNAGASPVDRRRPRALVHVNIAAAWTLAACDLGMDCGATSQSLDRRCLSEGLCGYPNLEAALRDGVISEAEAVETEVRRQWLVARIRSGAIDGMFDPPPAPDPRGR